MTNSVPHKESTVKPIRLGMIEDNVKVRDSVIKYLNYYPDINILHSFGSAESYLEHCQEVDSFKLDVLLLDIGLPGISGIDALPKILKLNPDLDVIMLTTYEEENVILNAISKGAVAYISKRSSLESILEAIRVVNQGGSFMSPMIAREFFKVMVKSKREVDVSKKILSGRQKEVLELLVNNKSYAEIADELYISVETVRSHIKKLYKILQVSSKNEAIKKYLDGEII